MEYYLLIKLDNIHVLMCYGQTKLAKELYSLIHAITLADKDK